ncbi:hypothetical protein FBZ82_10149 [Azospirillum brasilense]|uniref:Uncharacterized protein n=1 Tax=Azospirillum brasilense TaxID=192 RepID=A0A560BN55_AZOBR|nr:hypothetical protein [Azospirillum brasilense]TWA74036.1 hypothetical protein FBZ82_10149 [Azospirillum brasilense]
MNKRRAVMKLRDTLRGLPKGASHTPGNPPSSEEIYAPREHVNALDPDRALVIGNRGVGKTFWASALVGEETRQWLAVQPQFERLNLYNVIAVAAYHGSYADVTAASLAVLQHCESHGLDTLRVWEAVLLRAAGRYQNDTVRDIAQLLDANPETGERTIRDIDRELTTSGKRLLLVFDGLDTLGRTWPEMQKRLDRILEFTRLCKTLRSIRVKLFMRLDQANFDGLWTGPDRSKIWNERARLNWTTTSLYDLLFHYMKLGEKSDPYRFGSAFWEVAGFEWKPQRLTEEEQREAIKAMAGGAFMTASPSAARIYDWIINHLADAQGEVMPRAFLELMRKAADAEPDDSERVFSGRSIMQGMRDASDRHLRELMDEYWWVPIALQPLRSLQVPCPPDELYDRWFEAKTVREIIRRADEEDLLLPVGFTGKSSAYSREYGGEPYLLDSLIAIAAAMKVKGDRIHFPDVLRPAAGLLRRGLVKRPRKVAKPPQ